MRSHRIFGGPAIFRRVQQGETSLSRSDVRRLAVVVYYGCAPSAEMPIGLVTSSVEETPESKTFWYLSTRRRYLVGLRKQSGKGENE
jgi:hypothetical protein